MLRAERAGPLAADALRAGAAGRVVDVSSRAAFVRLDDGPLVAVLPAATPLHPWAVVAAAGAPPEAGAAVRLSVDGAAVPGLCLTARPATFHPGLVRALASLVRAPARPDDFDEALSGGLHRFRALGDARALAGLVGLGPGLTPSGDDIVVGALAALDLAQEARPAAAGLRDALAAALDGKIAFRTPRLSAQLLSAALAGFYAEPLLALLEALATAGSPGALAAAADALTAVGHRSGTDMLRGVAAAMECVG